ncbi:MAG: hypothetical protein KJO98_09530 [Rhodothermia bacterium]|nr:hypothetical protein [Rhodothermia bacterium]
MRRIIIWSYGALQTFEPLNNFLLLTRLMLDGGTKDFEGLIELVGRGIQLELRMIRKLLIL